MTSFHQVVVAAAPGDAVTSAALTYRGLLRSSADSEVFARYIDPALAGDVLPLEALHGRAPASGDRLLFHASVGDAVVFPLLQERPEPLTMVFHNLSPAEPFDAWDPAFAHELRTGREQVAALAARVDRVLTPSAFNADELVALGYERSHIEVVPLVVDLEVAPVTEGVSEREPTVLFVGQQYPHKRVELVVEAVHIVATYLLPSVRCRIVGTSRTPPYRDSLVELVRRLRAPVELVGSVDDAALREHYAAARVFVTASDHEGFCVPVLEAMSAGVPVVAKDRGAVAETAGGGALVLPGDAGPALIAEAVAAVLDDDGLARRLIAAGRRRVAELDPDAAAARFVEALGVRSS